MPLKYPKIPKNWEDDVRRLPKVLVEWVDATVRPAWTDASNLSEISPSMVMTLGYYIPQPKNNCVNLAQGVAAGGFLNIQMIPLSWVKSVKVVK